MHETVLVCLIQMALLLSCDVLMSETETRWGDAQCASMQGRRARHGKTCEVKNRRGTNRSFPVNLSRSSLCSCVTLKCIHNISKGADGGRHNLRACKADVQGMKKHVRSKTGIAQIGRFQFIFPSLLAVLVWHWSVFTTYRRIFLVNRHLSVC